MDVECSFSQPFRLFISSTSTSYFCPHVPQHALPPHVEVVLTKGAGSRDGRVSNTTKANLSAVPSYVSKKAKVTLKETLQTLIDVLQGIVMLFVFPGVCCSLCSSQGDRLDRQEGP